MNTDLLLYGTMVIFFGFGWIAGRYERKDSYVKGYKRGISVGKRLGNER